MACKILQLGRQLSSMIKIKKTIGFGLGAVLPLLMVLTTNASTISGQLNSSTNNGYSNNGGYSNNWNNNNWNDNNWNNNNNWNGWNNSNLPTEVYNFIVGKFGNNMTNQQKIAQLQQVVNLLNQKIDTLQTSNYNSNNGNWWGNGWHN